MFCVRLSSHSTPPSHLGSAREVNITVRSNDDPFGVIEFILPGMMEAIKESKGSESFSGWSEGKFKEILYVSVEYLIDIAHSGQFF